MPAKLTKVVNLSGGWFRDYNTPGRANKQAVKYALEICGLVRLPLYVLNDGSRSLVVREAHTDEIDKYKPDRKNAFWILEVKKSCLQAINYFS